MSRRKNRPNAGDAVKPGMSQRDVAAAIGMSRRQIWQAVKIASIPEEEFERMVESDNPPSVSKLLEVAHKRAGSATDPMAMPTHLPTEGLRTAHLTPEQFGTYELLRRHRWANGQLPSDPLQLAEIIRQPVHRVGALMAVVRPILEAGEVHP